MDANPTKPSLRVRARVMFEVTVEVLKKKVPIAMLVVGSVVLGYATKNIEDEHERRMWYAEMADQKEQMNAQCDARLVDSQKLTTDQTGRIEEQTQLIKQLKFTLDNIQLTQHQSIQLRQVELKTIKKAATEAQTAAVVASKGATAKDRQQINEVIKEKTK